MALVGFGAWWGIATVQHNSERHARDYVRCTIESPNPQVDCQQ